MTGSGTITDPYIIENVTDLQAMASDLAAYYELGGNINAGGVSFTSVGTAVAPFTGSFNGKGYTISNLTISQAATNFVGLFGLTSPIAIANVALANVSVSGHEYVGALAGEIGASITISNCSVSGTVTGADDSVGGLIGYLSADDSSISKCSVNATISGDGYVGGVIGSLANSCTIEDCTYSGNLTSTNGDSGGICGICADDCVFTKCSSSGTLTESRSDAGGIAGLIDTGTTLTDCHSSMTITAARGNTGGLVGFSSADNILTRCYATGDVTCSGGFDPDVGGLAGYFTASTVTDCWASGHVTNEDGEAGGLIGYADGGTYTRCYATGNVISTGYSIGGLIGFGDTCILAQCYATGDVSSADYGVGGLVGIALPATISECSASGDVSGEETCGGLVGAAESFGGISSEISDCFARGTVYGSDTSVMGANGVGGLIGYLEASNISNSYSTGAVTIGLGTLIGAFIGEILADCVITDSYWDTQTSGLSTDATGSTAVGKTTGQMKAWRALKAAGWDFTSTWGRINSCNDGYPCLRNVNSGCKLMSLVGNPCVDQLIYQRAERMGAGAR